MPVHSVQCQPVGKPAPIVSGTATDTMSGTAADRAEQQTMSGRVLNSLSDRAQ